MSRLARGAGRLVLAAIILAVPAMCRAILQAPQALAATGLAPASSKAAGEVGPARLPAPADLAAAEADARAAAHAEEARRLAETLARVRRLREARLAAAARAAPNPVARAGGSDGLPSSPGATLAMAPSQLPPVGKGEGGAAPAAAGEAELAPRRVAMAFAVAISPPIRSYAFPMAATSAREPNSPRAFCRGGGLWGLATPGARARAPVAGSCCAFSAASISAACPATCSRLICTS
jgi:hypothetical protein